MAESGIDTTKLLLGAGAIVAAYFGVIVPLEQKLGITTSAATAAVATATQTPGTPFSPTFYQTQGKNITILTQSAAQNYATTIYNALNTWFTNDFNAVMGVFTSLHTQGQVSFLAYVFQQMYNADLLTWLEYANGSSSTSGNSWFGGGGLTDAQVAQIVSYVNALPNT